MKRAGTVASLAASVSLLMVACGRNPAQESKAVPETGSDQWTLATFTVNCRGCHSSGAEGAAIPLMDSGYWMAMPDAQAARAITQGQGKSMPAFADSHGGPFSPGEVDLLVKGMRRLWGGAAREAPLTSGISGAVVAGDAARGEAVFASACASCHGSGAPAGSVVDPMYLRLVSDQAIWTNIVVGRRALGMPAWNEAMGEHPSGLTPRQVTDVVAWISSLRSRGAVHE